MEKILEMREMCAVNSIDIIDKIREFFNCREADVDINGDIWISTPQTGHWISEEEVVEFIEWMGR